MAARHQRLFSLINSPDIMWSIIIAELADKSLVESKIAAVCGQVWFAKVFEN